MKSVKFWKRPAFFYVLWLAAMAALGVLFWSQGISMGWLLLGLIPLLVFACRPSSQLHSVCLEGDSKLKTGITILVAVVTIAICVLPMDWLPLWNGEVPDHRNQYELMAENILEGRFYFDYEDGEELLKLENPYDPAQRHEAGVYYHWDHAFYKGRYYMYFGVVPVFWVFLPYRVLTGNSLPAYQGTQLFVTIAICGIFMLLRMIAKRFFPKMSFGAVLTLSSAISIMSMWYSTVEPALYCTAITAGIALEVWSLYFFFKAVWVETQENEQIALATIGATLGALVFGCRPTIALANVVVLPLLVTFLKKHTFSWKLLGKLCIAVLPYVLVGAALMYYNYARFEDPFEFGQTYQLTAADQSNYATKLDFQEIIRILNGLGESLLQFPKFSEEFPYLRHGGVLINFPILLFIFSALRRDSRKALGRAKISGLFLSLIMVSVVITVMGVVWTPFLLERYHMDFYFLLGIGCFIAVGIWCRTERPAVRKKINTGIVVMSTVTVMSCFLLGLRAVNTYYPEKVEQIGRFLFG